MKLILPLCLYSLALHAGILGSAGEGAFAFTQEFQTAASSADRLAGQAAAEGITSLDKNPAGIIQSNQETSDLAFSWLHQPSGLLQGSFIGLHSYAQSMIGWQFHYRKLGNIQELNTLGEVTGKTHVPYHYGLSLHQAYYWNPQVRIGHAIHWYQSEIAQGSQDLTASAIAVDLGIQYQKSAKSTSWGISAMNIGQTLTPYTEDGEVKRLLSGKFSLGMATRLPFFPRVKFLSDLEFPLYADPRLRTAFQYQVHRFMLLRASYSPTLTDFNNIVHKVLGENEKHEDPEESWPLGAGVSLFINRWQIDYGVQAHPLLPWKQRFQINYAFLK